MANYNIITIIAWCFMGQVAWATGVQGTSL